MDSASSDVGSARQPSVITREATRDDVEAVVLIDDIARTDEDRVAFIERAVRGRDCVIADADGQVLGYGVLEYSFFGHGFISMVYVRSDRRRAGVGRRLVEALLGRCRTSKVFTSTNESNRAMRDLLAGLGFVPSGVVHNLDPGDHELVFCKTVGGGR
jgi:ribosomal protein S18 acetylase RimI-like enzyme